jgi:hypothetical protein
MDRHRNDFQKNVHLGDIAVEEHAFYTKLLDLMLCYVPEPQSRSGPLLRLIIGFILDPKKLALNLFFHPVTRAFLQPSK